MQERVIEPLIGLDHLIEVLNRLVPGDISTPEWRRLLIAFKNGYYEYRDSINDGNPEHEAMPLEHQGRMVDIDVGISNLIKALWDRDLNTDHCCQEAWFGWALIGFTHWTETREFMKLIDSVPQPGPDPLIDTFFANYEKTRTSGRCILLTKDFYKSSNIAFPSMAIEEVTRAVVATPVVGNTHRRGPS
jgi:hypothetical protein